MKRRCANSAAWLALLTWLVPALGLAAADLPGTVVFEATSAYHHMKVVDHLGLRTLSFDGSWESRMSLANPLQGHFEYTEFFHLPWIWNTNLSSVVMIGLGGGSIPRSYARYYTNVLVNTVEIDPAVFRVATQYFSFKESPTQRVHIEDGRVFLRRCQTNYDAVFIDAYLEGLYGSAIPYHLVTKEFFTLARDHLTTNGVLVFNCVGTLYGWQADLLGAITQTLKSVFPQVYLFPARESRNVVLLATKSATALGVPELRKRNSGTPKIGRAHV